MPAADNLQHIRIVFGASGARKGARVAQRGKLGIIQGATKTKLRVLFDGEAKPRLVHPTLDGLHYL